MIIKLGSKGSTVSTIQEWLAFLGYKFKKPDGTFESLTVNGIFDEKTESVVMNFQTSESVYSDGIVGPVTMKTLEKAYTNRVLELNSPGTDFSDAVQNRFPLERVYADHYDEGYTKLFMRCDAADAYALVRKELIAQGGILTSSGTMRSLNAQVTQSRSSVSFHYLGLALDLYIYSGMTDPSKDPFVVVLEEERLHRVYARCKVAADWKWNAEDKPSQITLPPAQTLTNIITYKQRNGAINPSQTDHFLDVTALFKKHGFERIAARKNFYDGDSMMGAEWWHFQYEKGLMPKVSTFGNELLKIFSEDTLKGTPPWEQRNRVFGINWF